MKVLLDTNILIHRETTRVVKEEIGVFFNWLDRLGHQKCVHPFSVEEIKKHRDKTVVASFLAKIKSYDELKTVSEDADEIKKIRLTFDKDENDAIDTALLNEVYRKRVDILITEDRKLHEKAYSIGIPERLFTIDEFLEKVSAENPDLQDYKVLSVKKEYFGNININDVFFDSFKTDYKSFETWFVKKSDEVCYVCKSEKGEILAFLYLKNEGQGESYHDISPPFSPMRRLKIGTFKVVLNGHKLGERFLKIIFDNALIQNVDQIYVTIFGNTEDQERLIFLLNDFGFKLHGVKTTLSGEEKVYTREFSPTADRESPRKTFPYASGKNRKFIVPIYPKYHTELFPDSILQTESPEDFIENKPNRNAIRKVYISRSIERNLSSGDLIVFYRTASGGSAYYTSVTTTLGIVENITTNISDENQFIENCRKRSVFSDDELREHWNFNPRYRPFIVNFLYIYTFPKRLNLKALMESDIIQEAPRGFEQLNEEAFRRLMDGSNGNTRLIIN